MGMRDGNENRVHFSAMVVLHLSYPAFSGMRLSARGIPLCGMALTLLSRFAGWRLRRRFLFLALHRAT